MFILDLLSGFGRIAEEVLVSCFGSVELFVWMMVAVDCVVSLCATLARGCVPQGCAPHGPAAAAMPYQRIAKLAVCAMSLVRGGLAKARYRLVAVAAPFTVSDPCLRACARVISKHQRWHWCVLRRLLWPLRQAWLTPRVELGRLYIARSISCF